MHIKVFILGPLDTNCFLLYMHNQAVVIDPGGPPEKILDYLNMHKLNLTHILNTHLHFDHIYGNATLNLTTNAPILVGDEDIPLLNNALAEGGFIGLPKVKPFNWQPILPGEITLLDQPCQVLATPGHTPGSKSFYFPQIGAIFTGDLIFFRSIGRTDLPGGNLPTLITSIRKQIFTLPGQTFIYAGHGPKTTVADEQLHNSYFK